MKLLKTNKDLFKPQIVHFIVAWEMLVFCIVVLGIVATAMANGSFGPETQILYHANEFFIGQGPLPLEITVHDPEGITEARCYFHFDPSLPFVSIAMKPAGNNNYTAILPQPTSRATEIEYVFLVVNSKRQVIVSPNYRVKNSAGEEQSLPGQPKEIQSFILTTPAIDLDSLRTSFKNPDKITLANSTQREAYGVVAGLFSQEAIIFETVEGYFGAFRLGPEQEVQAIKGFMVTGTIKQTQGSQNRKAVAEDPTAKSAASTPDIAGTTWEGEFFRTDSYNSTVVALTAVITKDENDRVTITTTKENLGHYLVGKIFSDGYMLLYDQYDDEDWTTFYGPASDLSVTIADYVSHPLPDLPPPPLNVIRLTRKSTFETPIITGALHILLN